MEKMLKNAAIMDNRFLKEMFIEIEMIKDEALKGAYHSLNKKLWNPKNKYLPWLAVLLEDRENFEKAEDVTGETEYAAYSMQDLPRCSGDRAFPKEQVTSLYINQLLDLAPNPDFRNILVRKVKKVLPSERYKERFSKNENGEFRLIVSLAKETV